MGKSKRKYEELIRIMDRIYAGNDKEQADYVSPEVYDKGLRFNEGKLKPSLVPQEAMNFVIRRMTKGAEKYTTEHGSGENNWKKGLVFTEMIDSMQRHLNAVKMGLDIDKDWSDELDTKYGLSTHLDGIIVNGLMMIHHYLHNYPDNRDKSFSKRVIGLDLDGVIFDLAGFLGTPNTSNYHDPEFLKAFKELLEDPVDISQCPVFPGVNSLNFEPDVYITARPKTLELPTLYSLDMNNLPSVPVVFTEDKVKACREYKVELFVEDNYDNFVELNEAGIKTLLLDRPWNRKYDVGHKRIFNLNEIQ